MLKQIIVWIIVSWLGGVISYFSQNLVDILWRSKWAEKYVWSTRSMYVLIGFFMIVIWFLIIFGVIPLSSPIESATSNNVLW